MPRKAAGKDAPAETAPAKKPRARKAAAPDAAPPAKPAAPAPKAPVEKERVVIPLALYEARKDDVKAPFKEHGLKWQFLGQGKGRYHKEGVHVFVQFTDDAVDYSVWGDDRATVDAILRAWRAVLGAQGLQEAKAGGEEAAKQEEAAKESDALRLWRIQEPQRRPGEPDFFFEKRLAEWKAKKPA